MGRSELCGGDPKRSFRATTWPPPMVREAVWRGLRSVIAGHASQCSR